MFARYIKKEIADLNGTGQTQAYYKMKTQAMSHEAFVELCSREGEGVLPDAFEPGETKHNVKNIKVTGISYRADKGLIEDTDDKCILVKDGESRIKKPTTTLAERIEKAKRFLAEKPLMRVMDYAWLTGLSRTTASMELRKIASDPTSGITSTGHNSQKYYILSKV